MQNLTEKAMLVRLSVSQWTARKYDRQVSKEVDTTHGVENAGRYNKVLIALESIKKISRVANDARTFHYNNTLPWSDEGQRILPALNFMTYSKKMRQLHQEFDNAVSDFLQGFPALKADAKNRLNGLYHENDYPDQDTLKLKYRFDVSILPIPAGDNFIVDLVDDSLKEIQGEIDFKVESALVEATKDIWRRISAVLDHMINKLSTEGATFRNSLVGNVVELVELLPKFNLGNDPEMEAVRKELEQKICTLDPDDLRNNGSFREQAIEDAKSILDTVGPRT